ncbi:hypothetical protein FQN54_009727 [Arachnomyces sp. PD_36]|nr:hypothetical protein FQN54_009727 [Arachnomyces sp. PD_36]
MSNYFAGPFGHILPIYMDLPNFSEHVRWGTPGQPLNALSTRQKFSSKRPVTLEFGTDTALNPPTPPGRCESMISSDPPSPMKEEEPCELGTLPSERQLLTPSSSSSPPSSPDISRARLNYSTSPSITSAQLFSPVDGTCSQTHLEATQLKHHHSTQHIGTPFGAIAIPPLTSDPRGISYRQCCPRVGGDPSTLGVDIQDIQDPLPMSLETPPSTPPPDVNHPNPISHYHQGQLPYHPNLANTSDIPSVPIPNLPNTTSDILTPKPQSLLPHVIDEQIIGGEGLCYIYSDGSYCPKLIDGEPVNADWGVTKAGKPRKRLAQACITCREKKIKCHPNLPKCDQCQKSGRQCRFESAPRGNKSSSKKPQALRKARSSLKTGLVANSPNYQYPTRIATNIASVNINNNAYHGAIRLSESESPTSISPVSGRSLSQFASSPADQLLPHNEFLDLNRPPKRRKV